jgi:hypothetical protein
MLLHVHPTGGCAADGGWQGPERSGCSIWVWIVPWIVPVYFGWCYIVAVQSVLSGASGTGADLLHSMWLDPRLDVPAAFSISDP